MTIYRIHDGEHFTAPELDSVMFATELVRSDTAPKLTIHGE